MRRRIVILVVLVWAALLAAPGSVGPARAADGPSLFEGLGTLFQAKDDASADKTATASVGATRAATPRPAGQGRRIALVIGNGNYQHSDNLPKLSNPTNDAEDIAAALRGFDFEVIEHKNLSLEGMNRAVAEFGSRLGGSEAALFYFAGHGIQVKGQNYLMPVDAKIDSEAAVPYKGLNVNQILDEMDNGKSSANIVMLDACRNNPISGKFRSGKSRGLASPDSVPKGTVIVYATDPGNVAADGDGRNGLFSAGLLTAFKGKDLSLDDVLTVASAEVERASGQSQTPYVNGPKTLQKNFYFRVTVDPGRAEIEKTFWTSIERSGDPADFEAYLRKYPNGSYRALAENRLKQLKARPAEPAPVVAAPVAEKPSPPKPVPPPVAIVQDDPETAFWNEVKSGGAREYLDAYLKQYPKGKYLALARIELKKLDDKEKAERAREEAERKAELARLEAERKAAAEQARQDELRAEQTAWERAKAGDSVIAYAAYLDSYPKGRYALLAQAAQQKVQREAADREKQVAAQRRQEEEQQRLEAERQRLAAERERRETEKAAAELRPGKVFKDCADCPEMVVIPAGSFEMGSPASEAGRDGDEGPQHRVTFRKPFSLAKYEVTVEEFRAFVQATAYRTDAEKNVGGKEGCFAWEEGKWDWRAGKYWDNPGFSQSARQPVSCISWNDAQAYVQWLARKTGKSYRLPSEAEWEYAARAGTTTSRFWGDNPDQACKFANVADLTKGLGKWSFNSKHECSDGHYFTALVGSYEVNAFGLSDMIGNVWEWTEDCSNGSYGGAPSDGSAWTSGDCAKRVLRGGSWGNEPQNARSAGRDRSGAALRFDIIGFRPARMLP